MNHPCVLLPPTTSAGKRRKDLVSRATAVLTDGLHEMTLQLWGNMATDETIRSLAEGSIAGVAGAAAIGRVAEGVATREGGVTTTKRDLAVFEITRLHPSFSFSCEALVLNGKSGTVRRMECHSAEAIAVSEAVLAAAAAGTGERAPAIVNSAKNSRTDPPVGFFSAEGARSVRKFESVAALMGADGFSGVGYLTNVVVRKVDAPFLSAAASRLVPSSAGCHDAAASSSLDTTLPSPVSCGGAGASPSPPHVIIYFGDPEESGPAVTRAARSAGVEAVLRVTADGGALRDVLGCIPDELLVIGTGSSHGRAHDDVVGAVERVASCLLDGLAVGGEQGERVDAVLACSASVDANGLAISRGTSYRLVSLHPNYQSGSAGD